MEFPNVLLVVGSLVDVQAVIVFVTICVFMYFKKKLC